MKTINLEFDAFRVTPPCPHIKCCPFCGSKPEGFAARDEDIIIMRCSNQGCTASLRAVDINVWNRRVPIAEADFPEFELLMRRFCMAPEGEARDTAKGKLLAFLGGGA